MSNSGVGDGARDLSADADWQVYVINKLGRERINKANIQLKTETSISAMTITAAT